MFTHINAALSRASSYLNETQNARKEIELARFEDCVDRHLQRPIIASKLIATTTLSQKILLSFCLFTMAITIKMVLFLRILSVLNFTFGIFQYGEKSFSH